jgi:hypothetical protein
MVGGRFRRHRRRRRAIDRAAVGQSRGPQPRLGLVTLQVGIELLDLRFQPGYLIAQLPRTVGNRIWLLPKPRHDGSQFSDA